MQPFKGEAEEKKWIWCQLYCVWYEVSIYREEVCWMLGFHSPSVHCPCLSKPLFELNPTGEN